jgi:hypothetical protein
VRWKTNRFLGLLVLQVTRSELVNVFSKDVALVVFVERVVGMALEMSNVEVDAHLNYSFMQRFERRVGDAAGSARGRVDVSA